MVNEDKEKVQDLLKPIVKQVNDPSESLDSAISSEYIQNNELLAKLQASNKSAYPNISFTDKTYNPKNILESLVIFRSALKSLFGFNYVVTKDIGFVFVEGEG